MGKVFKTGEVAKMLCISQQTVIRCCENGKLEFYRVPDSRHRRITEKSLRKFMEKEKIPMELLDGLAQEKELPAIATGT